MNHLLPEAGTLESAGTKPATDADVIRCRDLTCRWVGRADIDHTVPYPLGYSSFEQRLLRQAAAPAEDVLLRAGQVGELRLPDGRLICTPPAGRTYTVEPVGAQLFPQSAAGELDLPKAISLLGALRGLAMPRRNAPALELAHLESNTSVTPTPRDTPPTRL